mmetsp:Transcript_42414/g.123235  ORF Transcript_42414/g.123235 Transcript_42414/m.123235 type:complete len:274 (+) Transcript_42414:659-1480(+)
MVCRRATSRDTAALKRNGRTICSSAAPTLLATGAEVALVPTFASGDFARAAGSLDRDGVPSARAPPCGGVPLLCEPSEVAKRAFETSRRSASLCGPPRPGAACADPRRGLARGMAPAAAEPGVAGVATRPSSGVSARPSLLGGKFRAAAKPRTNCSWWCMRSCSLKWPLSNVNNHVHFHQAGDARWSSEEPLLPSLCKANFIKHSMKAGKPKIREVGPSGLKCARHCMCVRSVRRSAKRRRSCTSANARYTRPFVRAPLAVGAPNWMKIVCRV